MPPKFSIKEIPISQIDNNFGQIEGVPENPRTITTEDFQNLKRSLDDDPEFLYLREPLVYPLKGRYVAIAGNQRIRALKELPVEFTPAKILDADTPVEDLIRWAVKDNTNKGEWDWDALSNGEWPEDKLTDWGLDMPEEWGEAHNPNPEEDEIPEPPKTPVSKLGDLWLLDGHRVLCGDSTDKATVERLMAGKKADIVFTDPPYGMNLDTDYSKLPSTKAQGNKTHKAVIGDNQPFNYQQFAWIQCKEQIWFGANYYAKTLPDEGSWLVWDKRVEEKFDRMFGSGFEIAWSKTPHKQKIYRHNNTLFGGDTEARGKEHPTQKPTKLLVEMMDDMFKGSKSVLDLFLGSGSTLIACEQTNRQCYGLELDPSYVDVVCSRWQTLTGTMPILESTGEAHDFIDVQ